MGRRKMRSENTWEPEENLDCPDLIQAYERDRKKREEASKPERKDDGAKKRKSVNGGNDEKVSGQDNKKSKKMSHEGQEKMKLRGFDRNLEPEKIVGATDASGELMFLMKWKGTDEADLVPSKQANTRCPQIVIQFYEERLIWHSSGHDDTTDKS